MTRDEHTAIIREIRNNIADEGKVTELLTQLSDDYGATITTMENIQSDMEATQKANESLRDTNMRLFLKVGEPQQSVDEQIEPIETKDYDAAAEDLGKVIR